MIQQFEIQLPPFPRGLHLITHIVQQYLSDLPQKGLLHVFIKHTSAGLMINENADPTVRSDFEAFLNRLVPENQSYFIHTIEGSDDMPAHIKNALIGTSLSIPITDGKLNLGTWQGIYLFEFRNHARGRKLVITILG